MLFVRAESFCKKHKQAGICPDNLIILTYFEKYPYDVSKHEERNATVGRKSVARSRKKQTGSPE